MSLFRAKEIASVVQTLNAAVMSLYDKRSCGANQRLLPAKDPPNIITDCVVCINLDLTKLVDIMPRRKLKPCVSAHMTRSSPMLMIQAAEQMVDKLMKSQCSSCNSSAGAASSGVFTTTGGGDQPINIQSGRYVLLNHDVCVEQQGVYYRHYFVPDNKGSVLNWFSCHGDKPRQLSSRLCCLLNAIHNYKGGAEGGAVKSFDVETKQSNNILVGPLGSRCMKQDELEESGPVLILLRVGLPAQRKC